MLSVSAALKSLADSLSGNFPASPGTRTLDVPFPLNDAFDPLCWLNSQPVWPQYWWQQRSGDEEFAALGALLSFTSPEQANAFLARQQSDELRISSLNSFDFRQTQSFLPRLEWRREGGRATLRVNLHSDTSLAEDALAARAFIASLVPSRPYSTAPLELAGETHRPGRAGWCGLIEQATTAIDDGEFDKVVLARATDLTFTTPPDAAALMAASRRVNLHCYHFYMAFDARQAFFGSSPERLWRRRGLELETEALAGTVASHPDPVQAQHFADWLMNDAKNQHENRLVVEDICQRLQEDVDALEILPAETVRLRKVQHLRRVIQAKLKEADDTRCLMQLQPTAAVAGLPRTPAFDFIDCFEPFAREWYAGSAGYFSRRKSEFCVTLRSAKVSDSTVRLYAGAGIVAGSQPDSEWQEIENKAAGLRSLLFSD